MPELTLNKNEVDVLEAPLEQGDVQAGNPLPIGGAHQYADGVNFVLFSRHATRDERQKSFACLILGQTEPDLFLMCTMRLLGGELKLHSETHK